MGQYNFVLCALAALLLACSSTVWAAEDAPAAAAGAAKKEPTPLKGPQSKYVVELTDQNLEKSLRQDEKNWFIHFYATFCGDPCIKADEVMDKLAEKYGPSGQLHVGRMRHNQVSLRRFDVITYPTLVYVRKGKYYVFDGDMEFEQVEKFAASEFKLNKEYTLPEATAEPHHAVRLTDANFDQKVFARRGAYWVVLFYHKDDYKDSELQANYEGLALYERGKINVGMIETKDGPKVFARNKIKETPQLYVFRGGKRYDIQDTPFEKGVGEDLITFAEGGYEQAKNPVEAKPEKPLRPEGTEDEPEDPNSLVQILTDEDFEEKTGAMKGNKGVWFVEFYTPWCGHCKALKPIWEEVAVNLREKMQVAKIDCTVNKNNTERFGIPGFPTLLLFRDGKYYRYNGERRVQEDITAWAIKGWQEQDGAYVPPPVGQPIPPATWAEEVSAVWPALQSVYEHKPWAANALAMAGAAVGFIAITYVYIIRFVLQLGTANRQKTIKKKKN